MEPAAERLPFVARVDDSTGPGDVIDVLSLAGFVAGTQPWARTVRLQRVRSGARLLPPGVEPSRVAQGANATTHLAEGDGWTLRAVRWRDHTVDLTVTATSEELGRRIVAEASEGAVAPAPSIDESVTIGFWHRNRHGAARRVERSVAAVRWPAIRCNYARSVAAAFDQVAALEPEHLGGRLLMLHGPPGTGKTTALRALAHAWHRWCRVDFVLDPDELFGDISYLMNVLLDRDTDDLDDAADEDEDADHDRAGRRKRWRLLVLEDCDELIHAGAKRSAGQALSRLLNLTDGVVGQGLDVLVCLTTTEDIHRLHPAVTRPGRCLAQLHVDRLPRAEALAWLGRSEAPPAGLGPDGATLAELFALRGDVRQVDLREPDRRVGQYL